MGTRLINVDRQTPMLLPPDLADWVPARHMVHFILEAIDHLDLSCFRLNWRGSGSKQYPPGTMLALLVYCYKLRKSKEESIMTRSVFNVSRESLAASRRRHAAPLALVWACLAALVSVQGLRADPVAPAVNTPPASVGKVAQADWDRYCQWTATLPADQLVWEKMLQKHLGGDFYFPVYLKQRLAGGYTLEEPDDWGFVQDDPALPRVLLIGDSISHMYTASVRGLLKGKANLHRAPANCYSTREGLAYLDDWLAAPAGKTWDVIHFAFGYHDRNRSPEQYAANLEKLIVRLRETGATLVWARTAPFVNTPDAGELYAKLNKTADAVMAKHPEIRVDDLYAAVADDPARYIGGDKIHYNADGVAVQAEAVAKAIADALRNDPIQDLLDSASRGRMAEIFCQEFCSGSKAASPDAIKKMKQDAIRDYEALLAVPEFKAEVASKGAPTRYAEAALDLAELYADAGQLDKARALLAETLKVPEPHRNTLLRGYTALANLDAIPGNRAGVAKAYRELLQKVPEDTKFGRHDPHRGYLELAKLALNYLEGVDLDALQLPKYTGGKAYPTPHEAQYSNDFVPLPGVRIEGLNVQSPLYNLIRVKFGRYGIAIDPKGAFTVKVNTADSPAVPEKPQAYALRVTKQGASICGADKSGTVWGVVSLIQLVDPAKKAIRICTIHDWPDTLRRGHSGSFANQVEYSLFNKENFVVNQNGTLFPNNGLGYPYPALHKMIAAAEAKAFADFGLELVYLERRVMWWKMSLDNENVFRMCRELGSFFASIGVSHGLAFDDGRYPGNADDLEKYGMLRAELDAKFIGRLYTEVKAAHPSYRLIFCPPFYWGPDARGMGFTDAEREVYLGAFGNYTDPEVGIYWSGGGVLARAMRPDQVQWFRGLTKRNPTLWQNRTGNHESLNYLADETPIDDWYYDGMVKNDIAAVMKNAGMPTEGTQCSVFANYFWNPDAYERTAALKSAMEVLFGQGIYEILRPGTEALAYFDRYLLNIQPAILKENVQDLEAKIALAEDAWARAHAISGEALDIFPAYYAFGIRRAKRILAAAKNPPDFSAMYEKYAKEVAQTEAEAVKYAGYNKEKGDILITAPGIFGGRGVMVNAHSMFNGDNRLGTPLYGAQTSYAKASCEFTLEAVKGDVEILVSGSDDEREDKCSVRVGVNGETLYEGSDAFPDKAYAVKSVVVPKKLLRKDNTIWVENLAPGDNPRGVPWIYINYIVVRPR